MINVTVEYTTVTKQLPDASNATPNGDLNAADVACPLSPL